MSSNSFIMVWINRSSWFNCVFDRKWTNDSTSTTNKPKNIFHEVMSFRIIRRYLSSQIRSFNFVYWSKNQCHALLTTNSRKLFVDYDLMATIFVIQFCRYANAPSSAKYTTQSFNIDMTTFSSSYQCWMFFTETLYHKQYFRIFYQQTTTINFVLNSVY